VVGFFLAGGFPMVLITVFGLLSVVAAVRFAVHPAPRRLAHIGALGVALVFAGIAGVAADLLAVATNVAANPEWSSSEELPLVLLVGFGESMTPAILSSSFVAGIALVVAVGLRRMG
jgi:hypothetical protein